MWEMLSERVEHCMQLEGTILEGTILEGTILEGTILEGIVLTNELHV